LELRHLRYFVAVAEEGSLSEAARTRLHTAQPSLSRQLRELEDEVGVQLFVRRPRGIVLTQAGIRLLEHSREILARIALRDICVAFRSSSEPRGSSPPDQARGLESSVDSHRVVRTEMQPVLVDLEEADLPLSLPVRKEAHEHLMFEPPLLLVEVKGAAIGDVAAGSLRILVGRGG
jgi:DNA-binding transcriptional LysR family regulator